jgi:hypothetical protein
MLKDIEPIKIPITLGGEKTFLRYTFNARRYLEEFYPNYDEFMSKDIYDMSSTEILHMLRAGLIESNYAENEQFIENGEWNKIKPTLAELGRVITDETIPQLVTEITVALIKSLPEAPKGNFPQEATEKQSTTNSSVASTAKSCTIPKKSFIARLFGK